MLDWTHILLRSSTALVTLFVFTRILGKKQISQLTFFEYITGIVIGDVAGTTSTDVEQHFFHGLLAMTVWFIVPLLLEMLTLKSKTLRHWFEGKGTVLIKDGKVLEDNLKKERYTADELLEQLRTKSVFRLADVEFAMLEASGDLSVMLKTDKQPITPAHLGVKMVTEKPSQTVIMDGVIQDEPLATAGKSRGWLHTELNKLGIPLENVFLAQVDMFGDLTVDTYDDKLKIPQPSQRPLLLATLKKCQADLELFALATTHERAKTTYSECALHMQMVLGEVEMLLKA